MDNSKIVTLYTGHSVEVSAIKDFLDQNNVTATIRDSFTEGIHAGIPNDVPDNVSLLVVEDDYKKAMALVELFKKS